MKPVWDRLEASGTGATGANFPPLCFSNAAKFRYSTTSRGPLASIIHESSPRVLWRAFPNECRVNPSPGQVPAILADC